MSHGAEKCLKPIKKSPLKKTFFLISLQCEHNPAIITHSNNSLVWASPLSPRTKFETRIFFFVPRCSLVAPEHNHLFFLYSQVVQKESHKWQNPSVWLSPFYSEHPIPPWQPAVNVSWRNGMDAFWWYLNDHKTTNKTEWRWRDKVPGSVCNIWGNVSGEVPVCCHVFRPEDVICHSRCKSVKLTWRKTFWPFSIVGPVSFLLH